MRTALTKLCGSRGFREVRSRDAEGPNEIELKYRMKPKAPLVTYRLAIDEEQGRPIVDRELLSHSFGVFVATVRHLVGSPSPPLRPRRA